MNAPLSPCSSSIAPQGSIDFAYNVPGQEQQLNDLQLAMRGPHQAANAAVALATIAELRHQGWCISVDAMRLGASRAVLPGRVEIFAGQPIVVLDTAHNRASARALVDALAELPVPSKRTLVLSISYDKDVRAIVEELAPHFDRIVVTQYQENPRAVAVDVLAAMVNDVLVDLGPKVTVCHFPADAWRHVRETTVRGDMVCIAGSFYLAAEMRRLVLGQ